MSAGGSSVAGRNPECQLNLEDGELVTTSPTNEQLIEFQNLAIILRARLVGEEGVDLTNAAIGESWLKKALIAGGGLAAAAILIWAGVD